MTYQDLINQVVRASGESGDSNYEADALRWLNFTRAEIADKAQWTQSLAPNAEVSVSSRANGIYSISSAHIGIASSWMVDETNNSILRLDTLSALEGMDPDMSVTGPPSLFADAGLDAAGVRQIRLYPRPDASYTLRYVGLLKLTDVTDSNLSMTQDDYFGAILPWSATFAAGMRLYKELDENENDMSIVRAMQRFDRLIKERMNRNTLASRQSLHMAPTKGNVPGVLGRLNPAHFRNF